MKPRSYGDYKIYSFNGNVSVRYEPPQVPGEPLWDYPIGYFGRQYKKSDFDKLGGWKKYLWPLGRYANWCMMRRIHKKITKDIQRNLVH